jgi:hypothetical protein
MSWKDWPVIKNLAPKPTEATGSADETTQPAPHMVSVDKLDIVLAAIGLPTFNDAVQSALAKAEQAKAKAHTLQDEAGTIRARADTNYRAAVAIAEQARAQETAPATQKSTEARSLIDFANRVELAVQ